MSYPMLATANGNGPYVPVIVYNRRRYQVGQAMEDLGEATRVAQEIAEQIRAEMRSPVPEGYQW